jgi:hypothetical protein
MLDLPFDVPIPTGAQGDPEGWRAGIGAVAVAAA